MPALNIAKYPFKNMSDLMFFSIAFYSPSDFASTHTAEKHSIWQ